MTFSGVKSVRFAKFGFGSRALIFSVSFSLFGISQIPFATQASAQAVGKGITNLEIPRFVSLKAKSANLRVGPGKNYAIAWRYLKRNIPLEVIQEFDYWRKVRDSEGAEGWVHHSLLQGKRTIITAPWEMGQVKPVSAGFASSSNGKRIINGMTKPDANAAVSIRFEPGVVAGVEKCDGQWCRVSHKMGSGWVKQAELWGVYPDEKVGK